MSEKREGEGDIGRDIDLQAEAITRDTTRRAAELRREHEATSYPAGPTQRGLRVVPGKEKEFHRLQIWLRTSDRLDRLIEATEPPRGTQKAKLPATALVTPEESGETPDKKRSVLGGPPSVRAGRRGANPAFSRAGDGNEKTVQRDSRRGA